MKSEDLVPVEEVGRELHLQRRQVRLAVLNGTLPVGVVIEPQDNNGHYVPRTYRKRWEAWKEARL